ncbi:MAG: exosortase H [Bacteroidota bacterium]|nr:exosortase H [Bacteroidota bacterium]
MAKISNKGTFFLRVNEWIRTRKDVLKFLLIFGVCLGIFSFILEREYTQLTFVEPHLTQVAIVCSKVLNILGTESDVSGSSISTSGFSAGIVKGCESIYPTAMLWAAVLAFPLQGSSVIKWKWKIFGLVGGAVILFILNIIRVVTMLYIGTYFPSLFDMIHIYAWQALFILITLAVFLIWAAKATK